MSKELLFSITKKDLSLKFFSGTGKGGQHRNKHQNCVRLQHNESGANVTGQSHKERKSNIKEALENLVNHPKFKMWHSLKVWETTQRMTIQDLVEEMMRPENIKIEYKKEGVWCEDLS